MIPVGRRPHATWVRQLRVLWRLVGALPRELETKQRRLPELLLDLLLEVDQLGLDFWVDVTLLGQWTGCKPDNVARAGSLLDRLLALAEVVVIPAVVWLKGVAVQRSRHALLNLVHRHHFLNCRNTSDRKDQTF